MKELVLLVGPPGSGKSTLAKEYEAKGYVRINQDDQGREGHIKAFGDAIREGKSVVVDRMNFTREQRGVYTGEINYTTASKHRLSIIQDWPDPKEAGYNIKIITLFVPYNVCLRRVVQRKDHPTIAYQDDETATKALATFFTKFERPVIEEAGGVELDFRYHGKEENKKNCIIVDLDGTICNLDHRLHYVRREGKKDWLSFFKECDKDLPNEWCVNLVNAMQSQGYEIIFASGRAFDMAGQKSYEWLVKRFKFDFELYMRHAGDYRQDDIVKEMLLDFEILPRFKPLFVVDDRQQVVDMWRKRGVTCLQCAKGDF